MKTALLVIAALLGVASATGYVKTYSLSNNEWFTIDMKHTFDVTYGLNYDAAAPETTDDGTTQTEGYGFIIDSAWTSKMSIDVLKTYSFALKGYAIPFKIVPFQYNIEWTRPEDTSVPFSVVGSGTSSVKLLDFYFKYYENLKTFEVSLYDSLIDDSDDLFPTSSDWEYNEDYENSYKDPYNKFNPLTEWTSIGDQTWYGSQTYFTHTII